MIDGRISFNSVVGIGSNSQDLLAILHMIVDTSSSVISLKLENYSTSLTDGIYLGCCLRSSLIFLILFMK